MQSDTILYKSSIDIMKWQKKIYFPYILNCLFYQKSIDLHTIPIQRQENINTRKMSKNLLQGQYGMYVFLPFRIFSSETNEPTNQGKCDQH